MRLWVQALEALNTHGKCFAVKLRGIHQCGTRRLERVKCHALLRHGEVVNPHELTVIVNRDPLTVEIHFAFVVNSDIAPHNVAALQLGANLNRNCITRLLTQIHFDLDAGII